MTVYPNPMVNFAGSHYEQPAASLRLLHALRQGLRWQAMLAHVDGIDVSHWQGDLGQAWWDAAAASGIQFAAIKCTEGRTFQDSHYLRNFERALAAGIHVIGYHFFLPDIDGEAQAVNLLANCMNPDFGVMIDVEVANNQSGATQHQRLQRMMDVLRNSGQLAQPVPWLYTSRGYHDRFPEIDPSLPFLRMPAHWTSADQPIVPRIFVRDEPGDEGWDTWQHASTGTVAGRYPIDLQRMRLPIFDQLRKIEEPPAEERLALTLAAAGWPADRIDVSVVDG